MKVGIIGGSGYGGGELLRILSLHPEVEVTLATSREKEGEEVCKTHPNLKGIVDLKFENPGLEEVARRCEFVFLAVPHGTSMKLAPELLKKGLKVVDLSGDFRLGDLELYQKYYAREHTGRLEAVYGLPELHRREIEEARMVANPGCYPTGAIMGLAPLVEKNLVERNIVVDSKSGISGAGAKPRPATHYPHASQSVLAYKVNSHQHLPEIEQELSRLGEVNISFAPHIVPVIRGLYSTMHCFLKEGVSSGEVKESYLGFYRDPFVRVRDTEGVRLSGVRGSNFIDIGVEVEEERGMVVVVSALDNLVKGASGQAVQNMNLMLGYEEELGLKNIALHP